MLPLPLFASDVLELRDTVEDDLPLFFAFQLDPIANQMAAFTAKEPTDRADFDAHWRRIMGDDHILIKTILMDWQVVGSVLSFEQFGEREVSYWIDRVHWGKGIATCALAAFLGDDKTRPLYARAAKDNIASSRVLQKCGFVITGEDKGYANARGKEIEEYTLTLTQR